MLSSCSLLQFHNGGDEEVTPTSSSQISTSSSSSSGQSAVEFTITSAMFVDEENRLLVNYRCNYSSPFNVAGHEFSRLNITGVNVNEENIDHSNPGRFSLISPVVSTTLKFEFYDIYGKIYISTRYSDVKLYTPDTPDIDYPSGYSTLYWSDEFDGESLNQSNWTYEIGDGSPTVTQWGNNEAEYYTNQNDSIRDGNLIITAKKEEMGGYHYTSTRIKTQNKVYFTYGYVEARIALPAGTGLWPAFWMMPNSSVYGGWPHSGEIDIMEARGRITNQSSSALHFSIVGGGHTYLSDEKSGHNITQYHKYAVEWTEDNINFFIDDYNFVSFDKSQWSTNGSPYSQTAPFDKDFYIILNLAVGGNFDGGQLPSDSNLPAEMKVDYVRVFKK